MDYNDEPVTYCKECYSLKIKYEDAIDGDVCMDCGCTETATTSIDHWVKLYESRYGHKFVSQVKGYQNSLFCKMPVRDLRMKVYRHPKLYDMAKKLYPKFPTGYNKEETVIVLFDKLSKDNRIGDLRKMLYEDFRNEQKINDLIYGKSRRKERKQANL